MKKYYLYILAIFSLSITTVSCSDFLDESSREKVATEDSKAYGADQVLTAAYGQFNLWDYAFSYLGITEIISDNSDKGSSTTDMGGDKDLLDNLTYTSSAGSFNAMWTNWYKSIGKSSQSIEYTKRMDLKDKDLESRYIAEAKFLRGLNYFFLVRGWGDVPIQEYDSITRVNSDSVYRYLIKDLVAAENALPLKSAYSAPNKGRATKGAAQGLLSKVYLYQKDYKKAYDYANKVISSGEYSLMTNYADIWKSGNQNNKESIFEFQAVSAMGGNVAQGIAQYSQTQGARGGSNPWGWGFNTPSDNLLKAFNKAGDMTRRNATIIFRNGILWDGTKIGNTENAMYNYKAYTTNSPGARWNDRSVFYMRYAEILLIKAEAANELGLTTEALAAVNEVRERAKLADLTTIDKNQLRELIWNERRLELAMEHDRWFDLIRTGQAAKVMIALGKPFTDKNNLFPIPNKLITQVPKFGQNPGW